MLEPLTVKNLVPSLWVKVPLENSGRAVGFVSRVGRQTKGVATAIGYFFVPSLAATVEECRQSHNAGNADLIKVFYGRNRDFKRWAVIGHDGADWAERWIEPLFYEPSSSQLVQLGDPELSSWLPVGDVGTRSIDGLPIAGETDAEGIEIRLARIERDRRL